ncbi:MAG: urease accessory protein UreD [Ilumatobacteraceae bacterium]
MHASAALAVECGSNAWRKGRIVRLRSDPPFVLRPSLDLEQAMPASWTPRSGLPVHVSLAAGAAGPIGGDRFRLDIDVGPGAALSVRAVAATIALPGPHGEMSASAVNITVAEHGTLVWAPGTLIAANGCRHESITTIRLAPHARLLLREEIILGRHGESPGSLRQRLRVTVGGRVFHDQDLHVGPQAPGWGGPAVTGGRTALGTILIVCDDQQAGGVDANYVRDGVARMSLRGSGQLITAVADDAPTLRRLLDGAQDALR